MDRGGKVMNIYGFKTQQELWEYLIGGGKITCKYGKDDHKYIHLIDGITRYPNGDSAQNCILSVDYWKPYHEVEEIRPEKAGELWRHDEASILFFIYDAEGPLYRISHQGLDGPIISMDSMVHGKGWTLIYSPDKEVMKKIKGLEDNSVETIEIEDVLWKLGGNHISFPYVEIHEGADYGPFHDVREETNRPMKMILEIPKEGK
jgi:hypothetical protein